MLRVFVVMLLNMSKRKLIDLNILFADKQVRTLKVQDDLSFVVGTDMYRLGQTRNCMKTAKSISTE